MPRQQRLGGALAGFIKELTRFPILVTIQPNFDWGPSVGLAITGQSRSPFPNAEKTWKLLEILFYRLDAKYTRCPRPQWLPSKDRFSGIAFMEKHRANAHIHLLISCTDPVDQFFRSLFLLEMLDNVEKTRNDPRDERWQKEGWEVIRDRGGWARDDQWRRTSSILTEMAPKGTAMAQILRSESDLERATWYCTKEGQQTSETLAAHKVVPIYDPTLDWRELREFHSDNVVTARLYRIGPKGEQILDLDNIVWKRGGKAIRS